MSLTQAEQLVFSHFVANGAQDFNMVGRFWPYAELVLVIEDKMRLGTRKFGFKADMACPKAARAFLDLLLEREAFSTIKSDLGGTMHQFQTEPYRALLAELRENDPLIAKRQPGGAEAWKAAFAEL